MKELERVTTVYTLHLQALEEGRQHSHNAGCHHSGRRGVSCQAEAAAAVHQPYACGARHTAGFG